MLICLFVISLSVPLYTYFIYPGLVMVLGVLGRKTYQKDESYLPTVSLIISTYNEEGHIRKKIENSLGLDYPKEKLEIHISSESTDRTNEIAQEYHQKGVILHAFSGRRGKAASLYRVVPSTRGEILVFSDANAFYHTDALRKLVRNLADPAVGCVVGQLNYNKPSESVGGLGEKLYWAYDKFLRKRSNGLNGFVPGVNGAIFAIRKPLYFPISPNRGDDYELCTLVAIHGFVVVAEPEAIADEAGSETTKQQFARKIRVVRWNALSSLILIRNAVSFGRWAIVFQIFSLRLLRYTVPFWLILCFLSTAVLSVQSRGFGLLLLLQGAFYAFSLVSLLADRIGWKLPKLLLIPSYFLLVNSAAAVAITLGVCFGQSPTWKKQR
ncbi:MAG: glycosyltransferase family 2 protein [Deltaproteobacteria bacterium]|nr:glycosyltransferase family 2 protein [Deltaproteobacteria bacterium]